MASIYANGARGHHRFTLAVSETGTSKENNTSAVSFQFSISPVVQSYDWRYWGNSISYTVTVNGTAFTGTIPDYDGYSTVILKSGSLNVPHRDDGTKTLSFGFAVTDTAGMSYTCGNAKADGQTALSRILRTPPAITARVMDSNSVTVALTGDENTLVRYFSSAAFSVEAEAFHGATVAKKTVTCGGRTLSGDSGIFQKAESGAFLFSVTDSYGNTAEQELTLPMIPYVVLTCNLTPTKPTAEGRMAVEVRGNCFAGSFGAAENRLQVFFRYRESSGDFGDWMPLHTEQSGDSYRSTGELTGLDYRKTYVFQAKAEDLLDGRETAEYTAKALPVFDWGQEDFNINGVLKLHGVPVADHIVEQGTDGIWHYRKWESGIAECWGQKSVTAQWAGSNGVYYSTNSLNCLFPEDLFLDGPVAAVTPKDARAYITACVFSVNAAQVSVGFGRFHGGTEDVTAIVDIYAAGRWK